MERLTDERVTEIESRARRGWAEVAKIAADRHAFRMSIPPQPDDTDQLLGSVCIDVMNLAAELRTLREATRWRTPDESGEWTRETLPEKGDDDDNTSIEVEATIVSPDGKRRMVVEGGYDFSEQRWHDDDAQNWLGWDVVAWRYKSKPYQVEEEK